MPNKQPHGNFHFMPCYMLFFNVMSTEDRLKMAYQTIYSEAKEFVDIGLDSGEEGYTEQEENTYAIKRMGKILERHQDEVLALVAKLEMANCI